MGLTRRAVVIPIQIGREYRILLKVRMHLNNYVNQRLIRAILAEYIKIKVYAKLGRCCIRFKTTV